ncbi:acyltransferase family protein, partial [Candidatus Pacearchaeota archaeon]|nr:acyltransferase family protein [Candidatus Pacearchaeota archaeon]
MEHKIEAIDYLRALSVLAIIIIHVIAWHDSSISTEYTQSSFLFKLRDFLQFSVVTLIICSAFSVYVSNKKISFKPEEIGTFYKKRIKRLLFPWWMFLIIFFSAHAIIKLVFNAEFIDLSKKC